MTEIYWGYLRAIYRESYANFRDEGKAIYDMVRMARIDGCPKDILDRLVQDLRDEGSISASNS